MKSKTFIYFGTPYVARDTLAHLVERGYAPALVVTSPDAPKGRGLALTPSETKEWAELHALSVFSPQKIDAEAIKRIKEVGADFGIVVAYGKILPQELIDVFPLGLLNVHYSLLPKYRGASPVETALLHDAKVTGVSIQKLVHELDAGEVYASKEVMVEKNETTRELRPRLIQIGAELLADMLPAFAAGELVGTPQNHAEATHSRKIKKEDGLLDLSQNPQENWNKYRAYAESPGTYFFAKKNGEEVRVKIKTASFENGVFTPLRIVPEGKKETAYVDFAR